MYPVSLDVSFEFKEKKVERYFLGGKSILPRRYPFVTIHVTVRRDDEYVEWRRETRTKRSQAVVEVKSYLRTTTGE